MAKEILVQLIIIVNLKCKQVKMCFTEFVYIPVLETSIGVMTSQNRFSQFFPLLDRIFTSLPTYSISLLRAIFLFPPTTSQTQKLSATTANQKQTNKATYRTNLNLLLNNRLSFANFIDPFVSITDSTIIAQMITWGVASPRVARDAPERNVTEVLNEAFQSFKSSLDDLVKQIEVKTKKKLVLNFLVKLFLLQTNELYQNISAQVKQFGENVKAQGQKVIEKVQSSGASS